MSVLVSGTKQFNTIVGSFGSKKFLTRLLD